MDAGYRKAGGENAVRQRERENHGKLFCRGTTLTACKSIYANRLYLLSPKKNGATADCRVSQRVSQRVSIASQ